MSIEYYIIPLLVGAAIYFAIIQRFSQCGSDVNGLFRVNFSILTCIYNILVLLGTSLQVTPGPELAMSNSSSTAISMFWVSNFFSRPPFLLSIDPRKVYRMHLWLGGHERNL